MPTLPTPNKSPGDGAPADDINLVIEAINTLQSQVDNIPAGPQGPQGEPGTPGANGVAATITVASTVTTNPGADAQVIEGGTAQNRTLAFYIPRGAQGPQGEQGPQGDIGPQGPAGESSSLYDDPAENLGSAAAGSSEFASRGDHVHQMPSYTDVGADQAGAASAAQSAAQSYAASYADGAVSTHAAVTTTVHGISNTANLVYTNDARLSNARTPTAHAVSHESGGSDELELAPNQITGTAVVTSDSRLSDARTPTAHAASHGSAGTDPVTVAQSQVTNLATDLAAKASATDLSNHTSATTSVHGISNTANLVYTDDARLSNARTPTAHATSHESGGADELELAPSQITGTAIVAGDVHLVTFVTSSTRPASPTEGQIIYETDTNLYYGWKGSAWSPIGGGATGGGTDDVFYENAQTVTANYTITSTKNAMSAGPITIDSGVTVTVPSGSFWTVV